MVLTIKKNLVFFLLSSLLLLSACGGGGSSQTTPSTQTSTTELYIKSAVYDNKNTSTTADDKLYIYFNKSIDRNSLGADRSASYIVIGTGAIGSASGSDYNDTVFHRHTIIQDNGATGSLAFSTANDTTISIAQNSITDVNGSYPKDYNQTTVEKFKTVLKTGQTTCYDDRNSSASISCNDIHALASDGKYQRGKARSYTDNGNGTIRDNITGLVWQKEDDNVTRTWADAQTYCTNLTLGGLSGWHIPSIDELLSITDKGRILPAINPIFVNVNSTYYWSSTPRVNSPSELLTVSFDIGIDSYDFNSSMYRVRCVY